MQRLFAILALFVFTSIPARAERWSTKSAKLTYTVVHPLHTVNGVSTKVQGVAAIKDGKAQVMARVAVTSFDSGNSNRDEHVLEVVEAAKHPHAVFKGIAAVPALPVGKPIEVVVSGEVEFHGVKAKVPATLTIERRSETEMKVTFKFATKLTTHTVERPSLMFVQTKDELGIEGELEMVRKP